MNVTSSALLAPVQKHTKLQEQLLSKILASVTVSVPNTASSPAKLTGIGTNIDLKG